MFILMSTDIKSKKPKIVEKKYDELVGNQVFCKLGGFHVCFQQN